MPGNFLTYNLQPTNSTYNRQDFDRFSTVFVGRLYVVGCVDQNRPATYKPCVYVVRCTSIFDETCPHHAVTYNLQPTYAGRWPRRLTTYNLQPRDDLQATTYKLAIGWWEVVSRGAGARGVTAGGVRGAGGGRIDPF